MTPLRIVLVVLTGLLATGCAETMGSHQPSLEAVQLVRRNDLPAMKVGDFALAPGRPASMDKSVGIRANTLSSPDGSSFSVYLGKTLEADLRAAGKLDPNSDLVVKGLLTQSEVSTGISEGHATLAARFLVARAGTTLMDKELSVDAVWESSFVGAIAIPEAENQYTALYDKLVMKLLADQDFRHAVDATASASP